MHKNIEYDGLFLFALMHNLGQRVCLVPPCARVSLSRDFDSLVFRPRNKCMLGSDTKFYKFPEYTTRQYGWVL